MNISRFKKPILIGLVIWTDVGLIFSGVGYLAALSENRPIDGWLILFNGLARAYVWGIFSPLIYIIAKRLPIDPRSIRLRNVLINLLVGVLVVLLYALSFLAIERYFNPTNAAGPPTSVLLLQRILVPGLYTFFSLYLPTIFAFQALFAFRNYREEREKNIILQSEVARAQLGALKMQLNPHFLFNSLHAISSLILIEPTRASKMVTLLGDFLRQTLEHSNEHIVSLEYELEFLRCYLEIEAMRFADRLEVEYKIDPEALPALVPHLILQPIVENAVKHGIAPFEAPGRIVIAARREGDDLFIIVSDSGSLRDRASTHGSGVGICNVRSRLNMTYGSRASLDIRIIETGCIAEIGIPFQSESHE